jgi:hypothetical protein
MKPFQKKIRPEDVKELIDFGLPGEQGRSRYASMATLQSEGVAAIYDILCRLDFAYLADEVGMGKTYQALGVAAVLWNLKPDARIVFVSPRANLQAKWIRDYTNFIRNNYRKPQGGTGDAILKCVLRGEPLIQPEFCNNLREFATSLAMPGRKVWFLRHTSFQRPMYVSVQHDAEVARKWESCQAQMESCGLWDFDSRLPCRHADTASWEFNVRFAQALRCRLQGMEREGAPAIDLLVVDEAQCLRHPDNQSNTVLREALKGNVGKWLFLSATPIHSGRHDVRAQINEYVAPDFITDDDVADGDRLTRTMRSFLVRRPRKFVIDALHNVERVKHQYRDHRKEPAKTEEPLGALAMALVQKKLVSLLDGRNNRFRIGFLSSFESLQESIQRGVKTDEDGDETPTDFYQGKDEAVRPGGDRVPADWDFVTLLDRRFKKEFGDDKFLPHPKLDHTVELLAHSAFDGNQKFLVFCRRIRAVEELRQRLDQRWHQWIELRIREVWNTTLDWRNPPQSIDASEEKKGRVRRFVDPEPEILDVVEEESAGGLETLDGLPEDAGFRNASKKGEWLFNYRLTFRDAGRNALVFQENWLAAICEVTGKSLPSVVEEIPEELFQEAFSAATREYSGRPRFYPAECLAYLATVVVKKEPERLGLDANQAKIWNKFLGTINGALFDRRTRNQSVRTDRDVFLNVAMWDLWRERFADPSHPMHLGIRADSTANKLFQREIIKNWIGQSYRLTDVILDLYFADRASKDEQGQSMSRFFDYLTGDTSYARTLRERTAGWIEHFDLILLNCFRPERDRFDLGSMAAKGSYPELNNQTAVVGVTGGSAVNETAIRQFKTPFYPQVIVCTDVLKEGEDLHVFCDQVVHYGVAWTSGDLEQRIGRVDRFFSQIERRLCQHPDSQIVKLGIHYPYLADTLEKWQIDRVHARVCDAEKILDNFDLSQQVERKDMAVGDDRETRDEERNDQPAGDHPFADVTRHLPDKGMNILSQSREDCEHLAKSFRDGGALIADFIKLHNMTVEGDPSEDLAFYVHLPRNGNGVRYRIEWQFVHDLFVRDQGVYAMRLTEPVPEQAVWGDKFSFAYERREEKGAYSFHRTHRVVFRRTPSPDDIRDTFAQVASYLGSDHVSVESNLDRLKHVHKLLESIPTLTHKEWLKPHKALLTFTFERTHQHAKIYVYQNMLLIVSPVAHVDALDESRFGRGGDRPVRIRDWCLDQNRQLTLGFLHVDGDGLLNFCERLFVGNLPDGDFQHIIQAVVFRADMYKAFLIGKDEN